MPISLQVDDLIQTAVAQHASDIHIEPTRKHYQFRLRIDGQLHNIDRLEKSNGLRLLSRIKLVSGLDIAEKRLPQDGRLSLTLENKKIDCRISTCPLIHGEKMVVRLFQNSEPQRDLSTLGLLTEQIQLLKKQLERSGGFLLITGPTGSGKTKTAYTLLNALDSTTTNIYTIEDPVEQLLPGLQQIQVHSNLGWTFPKALKTLLRQDPDTIFIGEIRDAETATLAIQAAFTGHRIVATLHTPNTTATQTRLSHLGINPNDLKNSGACVVAQRLVRRLCTHCRAKIDLCPHCRSGFSGRIGIFEISEQGNPPLISLHDTGLTHVQSGITTLIEINTQLPDTYA